ncbi:MAG: MFS transporter, partial [Candidatus Acidiferrales bacterium]
MAENGDGKLAGRIAFRYPAFRLYEVARFFTVVSMEMLSVAVGWQIYEITHRVLDLGYVGLAQFLPGFLLFLISGHAADRFDRRKLLVVCYVGFAVCAGLLLLVSLQNYRSVGPIYAVLVLV